MTNKDDLVIAAEDILRRHATAWKKLVGTRGDSDPRVSADRNRFGGAVEMMSLFLGKQDTREILDRLYKDLGETPPMGVPPHEL